MTAAEVDQDTLPGMPPRPRQKPRKVSAAPTWTRIRPPKRGRPIMCSECSLRAANRKLAPEKVEPAAYRRRVGELVAHYCHDCAEKPRERDRTKKRPKRKRGAR